MEQHFVLMVQSVCAGLALGMIVLVLSYGFGLVARYLHTVFIP